MTKNEIETMFFASFQGKTTKHHRYQVFEEDKSLKDFYDWLGKHQREMEDEVVIINVQFIQKKLELDGEN